MNTPELLSSIDSEIVRLQQVRSLLAGRDGHVRLGRKPRMKRTMSAEARARIAAAQRARWAKQKKAVKAWK
jgi:topoisomerase IA-like protein